MGFKAFDDDIDKTIKRNLIKENVNYPIPPHAYMYIDEDEIKKYIDESRDKN